MILFIFTLLTIILPIPIFTIDCDNYHLFNFGLKPFCELNDGNPISCFGSFSDVKTAYIQCEKGYYQKDNISQQILDCNHNNGEWSDKLMDCSPECIEPPNEIKIFEDDTRPYPLWYAEIIRKTPSNGEINKIPGMIFFEREIITLTKFIGNYSTYDLKYDFTKEFFIRTYTNKTLYKDYQIQDIDCMITPSEFGIYCVIQMPLYDYIKFNQYQKPVCTINLIFELEFFNYFHNRRNKRLSKYVGPCIVPHIKDSKIEMVCFKDNYQFVNGKTQNFKYSIDCREDPSMIIMRCRIGYQYKNPVEIDYLSNCILNNWYYQADNGCDLKCGEINNELTARIYQGNEIHITSVPWHVGIFANHTDYSNTYEQICGGTIIHSNIVISAAHCFYDDINLKICNESNYLIGAGKNFRNYSTIEVNSIYSEIKKIYITENYQPTDFLNDIAILILKKHFEYSSNIQPACIDFNQYKNYSIKDGIKGYIVGWGLTTTFSESNNNLLTADLTTVTNDECKKFVRPQLRSQIVGDKFCALNVNNATACQGDSGGGFIVKKNIGLEERYYFTGIISSGIDRSKQCTNGFLAMFTNIQFYQNFINDIISEERNI